MQELGCVKAYFEDTDSIFTPRAILAQVLCHVDKIVHGKYPKRRYFVAIARSPQCS